jgi:exodeoxyribonuclease-3
VFRLVSLNLNGIRSAAAKGVRGLGRGRRRRLYGRAGDQGPGRDLKGRFDTIAGMKGRFHFAEKKGCSGVGLYSRKRPSALRLGFCDAEFDAEGRCVECRFDRAGDHAARVIDCDFTV